MEIKQENSLYQDIINLPHHVSKKYPQMPIADRAAQFAPFSALTGHKELIREVERIHRERFDNNSCTDDTCII